MDERARELVGYCRRILFGVAVMVFSSGQVHAQKLPKSAMPILITSPRAIPPSHLPKIFLAGSIDMGAAKDWQKDIIGRLTDLPVVILNPRRSDWDPAWRPDLSDPHFEEQVRWELAALEQSDIIVMVLTADSKSPVSLLELGLYARSGRLIIYCQPGYWRKGNVDAVSAHYKIKTVTSMEALISELETQLRKPLSPR